MRHQIRNLALSQEGVFARWQLRDPQVPFPNALDWAVRGVRRVFPGVYVTGWGPVTQRQHWRAATLTAPATALCTASAAGLHEIRPDPGLFVTVVRPGHRGATYSKGLRVSYSKTLASDLATVDGIPTTTVERTIIDLWPHLTGPDRSRMLREALRIEATDAVALLAAVHRHRRRRGARALRKEVQAQLHLPFARCKSPAEAHGLVVLDAAGVEIPAVNEKIAGEEADFIWYALRLIIEIDGPQWHRFREEDARKTAAWVAAGYTVRRISSDRVFEAPAELLRLAPAAAAG